jgi:Uma2 family endonuclease
MNIARAIGSRLGAGPCRVYDSNLRIRVPVKPAKYLYADATIICGAVIRDDEDPSGQSVINPRVVIEVLSPSTELYDRGPKFAKYKLIPSFEEYILVSQSGALVEGSLRTPDGWLLATHFGMEASATIRCLGLEIPLAEIYAGITFPASAATDD